MNILFAITTGILFGLGSFPAFATRLGQSRNGLIDAVHRAINLFMLAAGAFGTVPLHRPA